MQRVPPPAFIEPMMAKEAYSLPEGPEWIYEVKWDGYRMEIWKDKDEVRLTSRNNKDLTDKFPEIAEAARSLKHRSFLMDGELVALAPDGRPSFQALQNRTTTDATFAYYAFDLLQLAGKPLTNEPLEIRKAKLAPIVSGSPLLRLNLNLSGSPAEIIARITELGLEGVIAKRRHSFYEPGARSGAWQKFKLSPEQEFVVGGYKPNTRGVESLVVGYYEADKLLCVGSVRQGLNPRNRVELGNLLKPLKRPTCPFANLPTAKSGHWGEGITQAKMAEFNWVEPKIVAQVSFVSWTSNLQLRHAGFKGIRDDKEASVVRKET